MSHSQFRSETLILRHAWLNLWDKHMTTGRINQVTWWRNQCGRSQLNPTERTTKFAVVAISKLHLNISSPIRRMIHALMISIPKNETPTWKIIRTDDNDQQSLLSHRPYVDSFRNMYKMQLHENLVSGLSSLGAESTRLNDFTSPVGQMLRPLKSSRYQDRILDHTRAGRRCFQISSSRGLTPLGSTDTWVLPISM